MTYTKEEALSKIAKLVDDFRAHEATLEKAAEAQIENNFIRPLFRYLNWNTENEGLSHAHYEFKVQVTNKKGLRPDYILNVDGRDVLVMDAKQVKYSMKDPRWLYQVYSYAYSTQNSKPSEKMDFAILTDFQEFIVLDCTLFAAKPEAVNNFRVLDWTYADYVDKFDELWELLERNNVLNDSKERKSGLWSRYLSPQKVKANRVAPDKAFLAQMDDEKTGWRVLLAKDMKKRNPSADGELITAAVQLLIDRLIFIKALSDREVDRDYLSEIKARVTEAGLGENEAGWFASCKTIFEELNNFYNGSIFAPRPELEHVTVSNKAVQEVIHDLQPENSPYNFAVLPVEILGTIYERFLGRVVRTTEKQVKIEEKPEVRKAGGVYYTPQYIVDYIVKNTLGKLVNGESGIGTLGSAGLTPADVAKLKILDPSCGSGSFLLGAYDYLIQWHKDYFARAGKEKRDRESFYRDESGAIRLTAKLKREILKNNLFGVDIDPQAVEVTRFSLSLKALEDLREGELTEERTLFHQTVLPDLSANIKNGNSLIGSDYFGLMKPTLDELKEVKPFNWNTEFSEIMSNGGFDCVIGNPPYVDVKSLPNPEVRYLFSRYYSTNNRINLFAIFIEKIFEVVNTDRFRFSMIVPTALLTQDSYKKLRETVLEKYQIENIIRLPNESFGNTAGEVKVDTAIFVFSDNSSGGNKTEVIAYEGYTRINEININGATIHGFVEQSDWKSNNDSVWSINLFNNEDVIIRKLEANSSLLEECTKFSLGLTPYDKYKGHTPSQIENQVFHADHQKDKTFKKLLAGNDVRRYSIQWNGEKWISYGAWLGAPREQRFFTEKRILVKQIIDWTTKRIWATITDEELYNTQNAFNLLSNSELSLEYILGILNSKAMTFYHQKKFLDEFKMRFQKILIKDAKRFPIRTIDFNNPAEKAQHEKMVALVSQMLELHKSKAGAKTQSEIDVYERQIQSVDESIDGLVYELYGLSEEEIGIVEGK